VPDRKGSFHAAVSHAGGAAWVGYRLYVADTDAIRVFDLHNVWRTVADSSHKKIGMDDGKAYAADYRYAIPQIGYYTPQSDPPHLPLRISSISLDRTSSPDSLITAEYKEDRNGVHSKKPADARIVRWDLDRNGKLAASGNRVHSSAVYVTSRANVNGAITYGDEPEFVLTTSEFDRKPGWIHRATLGHLAALHECAGGRSRGPDLPAAGRAHVDAHRVRREPPRVRHPAVLDRRGLLSPPPATRPDRKAVGGRPAAQSVNMTAMNVAQKLIRTHLVQGEPATGEEVGPQVDQTLTQDATGTVVMLELEALELNGHRVGCHFMLLRLAYLGVTNAFALLRLLPGQCASIGKSSPAWR
jgi:hypothetical protein